MISPKLLLAEKQIIIDHRCTDISQIPEYWLKQAQKLTVHYAHTSHGAQIVSGLLNLESLVTARVGLT